MAPPPFLDIKGRLYFHLRLAECSRLLWLVVKVQEPDLNFFVPNSNFRYFFCPGMTLKKNNIFLSCFNRLETISNSIKTSYRIAKLKAKLYREKKVTHNRTHWLQIVLSEAVSSTQRSHLLHFVRLPRTLPTLAWIRAKASFLLRWFLVPDWQRTSVLLLNIPRTVKESPNLLPSVVTIFVSPPLGWQWTTQRKQRDTMTCKFWWHTLPGGKGLHVGGFPEGGPKGMFVSHSGAWHISGRNCKVQEKIF